MSISYVNLKIFFPNYLLSTVLNYNKTNIIFTSRITMLDPKRQPWFNARLPRTTIKVTCRLHHFSRTTSFGALVATWRKSLTRRCRLSHSRATYPTHEVLLNFLHVTKQRMLARAQTHVITTLHNSPTSNPIIWLTDTVISIHSVIITLNLLGCF